MLATSLTWVELFGCLQRHRQRQRQRQRKHSCHLRRTFVDLAGLWETLMLPWHDAKDVRSASRQRCRATTRRGHGSQIRRCETPEGTSRCSRRESRKARLGAEPPIRWRSTRATLAPRPAAPAATISPAVPAAAQVKAEFPTTIEQGNPAGLRRLFILPTHRIFPK